MEIGGIPVFMIAMLLIMSKNVGPPVSLSPPLTLLFNSTDLLYENSLVVYREGTLDFFYRLGIGDDLGLPTGPLTITFCDNVLLEHGGLPHVLALAFHQDFYC